MDPGPAHTARDAASSTLENEMIPDDDGAA